MINPLQSDVELETRCEECRGLGEVELRTGMEVCEMCGGAGYIPTPVGEKIIDLMRHNFRPMLRNAIHT